MKRIIPERVREWLLTEMELWRTNGCLTEDQQRQILDLYESDGESAVRRRGGAIYLLQTFAALLAALSVLLLVSYNWDGMTDSAKIGILFGGLVVIQATSLGIRWRHPSRGRIIASEIGLFLGCFLYGASIWLIAQIFNIESRYPNGFWFWAIGSLVFAWRSRTPLIPLLVAILAGIWVSCEAGSYGTSTQICGWYFADVGWSFPILAAIGIAWAYGRRSSLVLLVQIIAILLWLCLWWSYSEDKLGYKILGVLIPGMAAATFLGVGNATALERTGNGTAGTMSLLWQRVGTAVALVWMLFWSTEEIWSVHLRNRGSLSTWTIWQTATMAVAAILLSIGGVAIAEWFAARHRAKLGAESSNIRASKFLKRQWLPLTITVFTICMTLWAWYIAAYLRGSFWGLRYGGSHWATLTPALIVDGVILFTVVWLIRTGIRRDRGDAFACGTLYFLLWTLIRYCDYFLESGGMLGAAMMFLACGVFLWGIAWFWGRMKKARMAENGDIGENSKITSKNAVPLTFSSWGILPGGCDIPGVTDPVCSGASDTETGFVCCCGRDRERCWCRRHERLVLIAGVLFQIAILAGMIVTRTVPYLESQGGKTVWLQVIPLDPRDMMRGDYVILNYHFDQTEQLPRAFGSPSEIFVTLVPVEEDPREAEEAEGDTTAADDRIVRYRMGEFSLTRPNDAVYLRGRYYHPFGNTYDFGIQQFYVQEGRGREIEDAIRSENGSVWAKIAIDANGHGQVQDLRIRSTQPQP